MFLKISEVCFCKNMILNLCITFLSVQLTVVHDVCYTMQAVWTMERSDEESENSSEHSFNGVVTAAMTGGYAIMSTMMVPPCNTHGVMP